MTCVTTLRCVRCNAEAPPPVSAGTCPACGDPFAMLQVEYDLERAKRTMTRDALASRPWNHWRYHELLPIEPDAEAFDWPVGGTPILETPRLAEWAGVARLRVKDDGRNPSASYKDRASSVGVLHARQRGATRVACASTGNAAVSLAGCAAMAGIDATIFVPRSAPEPKLAQLLVYGAEVRRVNGTYAQAYDLCTAECAEHGWYNRNCAINPWVIEGKKTCGLEIAEQTAARPPDWVVVSVGDGCTIASLGLGLRQMHALGYIDRVPRLLGVQAEGVAPIARAFAKGGDVTIRDGAPGVATMADSIDVPVPRNWRKAINAVRATDGTFVCVSDEEIMEAMRATGARAGVFAEPAAAASMAGLRRAVLDRLVPAADDVVVVITGSGLKDVRGAMRAAGDPIEVEPLPA